MWIYKSRKKQFIQWENVVLIAKNKIVKKFNASEKKSCFNVWNYFWGLFLEPSIKIGWLEIMTRREDLQCKGKTFNFFPTMCCFIRAVTQFWLTYWLNVQ